MSLKWPLARDRLVWVYSCLQFSPCTLRAFTRCLPPDAVVFWTTQLCRPATSFSVRWRFIYGKFWKIYVNGTLRRDITKPPFLSLRASFTETFSALNSQQSSSSKRPSTLDAESQRSPEFLHVKSQCYLQKSPLFNPWHLVFGCFLIGKYTNSEK